LFLSQLIIRSHEGPDAREKRSGFGGMDEGYTVDHVVESGKLITLFSAPDYPQFQVSIGSSNLGFVVANSCL
jgi:serine/threonine-protein phosphatase 5